MAVIPVMLGLSWGGSAYGWYSVRVIIALCLSLISAVCFVVVELRAKNPIMPLTLYRNSIMSVALVITLLLGVTMFTGSVFMPLFFQGSLGKSATTSGLLSTAMMLGSVLGATSFGQLLSRFGGHYRILGLIGIFIMGVGLLLMSQINTNVSLGFIITSMVIMSFGMGTTFPCFNIGVATSSAQFVRSLGASAGLAVLGSLLTTRFATRLDLSIPEFALKNIPAKLLSDIKTNPNALMDNSQISNLESQVSASVSNKSELIDTVLLAMRQSLADSIAEMFIVGLIISFVAFVITFWLKEIPLQKRASKEPVKK